MGAAQQTRPRRGVGDSPLAEIERLEAPDRSFVGHRDIVTRSLARYAYVAPFVRGRLLDVGCGRGYGFEIVGPRSDAQAGVDLSPAFLAAARATYPAVGLAQSSGERLPFRDRAFESVISFEVIEHLQDDGGFLAELRRVTRPGGVVAISTPNRVFSSDGRARPINPFHVREYAADEFARLLRSAFNQVTLLGQHDSPTAEGGRGHLLDRVPMGWKYLVPTHVQGVLSVLVRRPLRIDDCRFSAQGMERAHSFLAICEL